MATSDVDGGARFEQVDWNTVDPSGRAVGLRSRLFLLCVGVVLAALAYDYFVAAPDPLFENVGLEEGLQDPFTWDVRGIDWLFVLSLLVFGFYVLYPLYEHADRTRQYLDELTNNRAATFALAYLTCFFFFGLFGTILVGRPSVDVLRSSKPPVSFATPGSFDLVVATVAVPTARIDLFTLLVLVSVGALLTWSLLAKVDRDRELDAFGDIAGVFGRVGLGFVATFSLVGTVFAVFPVADYGVAAGIGTIVGVGWAVLWLSRSDVPFGVEHVRAAAVVLTAFAGVFLVGFVVVQTVVYDFFQFDPVGSGVVSTSCPDYASAGPGQCYGTWDYPLGSTRYGLGMIPVIFSGMRVSLQVALISSMLIVPLATMVGTVAGYVGGVVDDVLMSYVDVQQTVPAIIVYMIAIHVFGRSLFVLVVVFGLLSWGGAARLVRSEVLQRREEDFVTAARSAGAGHWRVMFRHVLPNVSNTVLTSVTRQIPQLILAETAIAFLDLNDIMLMSWGETIASLLKFLPDGWWMSTEVVVVLAVTVLSFSVLGDALRDVLDPRGDS
ncbi:ABC transporter permease [Haloarchaeobius sp. HRN-SO-5]|uniref:ABC transporter permease n=1 Tax=Haloarchaeobius sp. HRN-SO-5 TaxID=3446118 RepID=UPI003EBA220B